MLLKIDVKPEDIIFNKSGRIIIKLHKYAQWANGAHLATVHGNTKGDFDNNKILKAKTLCIGGNGGMTLD